MICVVLFSSTLALREARTIVVAVAETSNKQHRDGAIILIPFNSRQVNVDSITNACKNAHVRQTRYFVSVQRWSCPSQPEEHVCMFSCLYSKLAMFNKGVIGIGHSHNFFFFFFL